MSKDEHVNVEEVSDPSIASQDLPLKKELAFPAMTSTLKRHTC